MTVDEAVASLLNAADGAEEAKARLGVAQHALRVVMAQAVEDGGTPAISAEQIAVLYWDMAPHVKVEWIAQALGIQRNEVRRLVSAKRTITRPCWGNCGTAISIEVKSRTEMAKALTKGRYEVRNPFTCEPCTEARIAARAAEEMKDGRRREALDRITCGWCWERLDECGHPEHLWDLSQMESIHLRAITKGDRLPTEDEVTALRSDDPTTLVRV